jgi:hypothetical protein
LHTKWLRIASNQRPFEVTCINPWYFYDPFYQPNNEYETNCMVEEVVKFADHVLEKNGMFKLGLCLMSNFYHKYQFEQKMIEFGGSFRLMKRSPIQRVCPEYKHQSSKEKSVILGIEKFTFLHTYIKI